MLDKTAQKLEFKRQAAYVNGQWIAADSGKTLPVHNPATGELIGTMPDCGKAETARAIEAANAAFPAWRAKTAKERAKILHKLADLVEANADTLGVLLTVEQGKSLAEAKGEVNFSAAYVRWFAEEAQRVYGDVIPSPWPGRRILVTKEPVGVVGAITPWNFPSSMIARKLGPALAAGCTIVIKPAAQTPYSGLAWGALAEMAGIPAGVVNVLTGSASAIGGELTSNPLVRKITFTGSTPIGKLLVEQSAKTLKKVSMELGGNAPFIVFDDADVDRAIEGAMIAKYRNSGQTCVCTNRFLVQSGIHDKFVEKLIAASNALKVGNGLEPGVQMGPMVNHRRLAGVQKLIEDAVSRGATIATGGKPVEGKGFFFQPTVLTDVPADAAILHEEPFGPVAPVAAFDDLDAALELANSLPFGLAAYAYTDSAATAEKLIAGYEAGILSINHCGGSLPQAPSGGFKESGYGREGGPEGLEGYLLTKRVSHKLRP